MKAHNEIKNVLLRLGFSDAEARIYLFVFKKGATTVKEIKTEIDLSRTAIYETLNKFVNNNLISYLETKPQRKYVIESPKQLELFIKKEFERDFEIKKTEYDSKLKYLQGVMPKFISNQSTERPKVRFYEGVNGLKNINIDIEESNPDLVYTIYNLDSSKIVIEENNNIRKSRGKALSAISKIEGIYYSKGNKELKSTKKIKFYKTTQIVEGELSVYENKIILIDNNNNSKMAVLIENERLANTIKILFKLSINGLKK